MCIDPALPLVLGSQHQSGFVRSFADSAPDRWGRNLIEKAERGRARRRLTRVGGRRVLILRRFDRAVTGNRIGYISAMTALGSTDGEHRDYADIAEAIRDLSFSPKGGPPPALRPRRH